MQILSNFITHGQLSEINLFVLTTYLNTVYIYIYILAKFHNSLISNISIILIKSNNDSSPIPSQGITLIHFY